MDAGEEHGVAQAGAGDLVAVGVRDALDEAVLAQPAEVVGGLAGCDESGAVGRAAEVFAEQAAPVLVEEPAGLQPEDQQDVQERLCARVGQAQPGDAGAVVVEDGVAGRAQDAVPRSPAGSVTLLDDRDVGASPSGAISMSSSKLANPEYSSHLEKSQQPEKDPGQ